MSDTEKHKIWNERVRSSKEIGKAVNNTYHKGIDPEGVPDMKEALMDLMKEYEDKGQLLGYDVNKARKALKKANLNEKAE